MLNARETTSGSRLRWIIAGGCLIGGSTAALLAGTCPPPPDPVGRLLEGDPAPGTPASFQTFDRPNLSAAGRIAFTADTDGNTSFDDVVYVDATLLAREGDPAPGIPGGTYSAFEPFETAHQVNAGGDVVYIATLRDVPADANRAVYRGGVLVAREGMSPASLPGRVYEDFGFAGVMDDGSVGFRGDLDGATSDDSVIVHDGTILYRQGDPVPGLAGVVWDGDFDEIQWNGRGDLLFEGNTSMGTQSDAVLFLRTAGGPVEQIVAREGQAVNAHTGPDALSVMLQAALAENGDWGVRGTLRTAPAAADAVVLTGSGLVVQEGDPAPGLPGVQLGNLEGLDVNGHGDVIYLADLQGSPPPGVTEGLFVNDCLLVTTGMQVPGAPAGTLFTDLGFEDLFINDDREIVFAASYTGGDGLFTMLLSVCPEDITSDGIVDVLDLLQVLTAWGQSGGRPDVNGDGVVDQLDLLAVLSAWGVCP